MTIAYATRSEKGSATLYAMDGTPFYQIHTALEEAINPRTNEEIEEIARGCGYEILEWR